MREIVREEGGEEVILAYQVIGEVGKDIVFLNGIRHLDLTHCNLTSLQPITHLTSLHTLILRQNKITELPPLDFCPDLTHLDLYDNHLTTATFLAEMLQLRFLDVSFNVLRDSGVASICAEKLPSLREIYLIGCRIKHTCFLASFSSLELIEIGQNRIKDMSGVFSNANSLRSLWIGKNKVTSLEHWPCFPNVRILSGQSNRLKTLPEDLPEIFPVLEELYLSHNAIQTLPEAIRNMRHLDVLDLAANGIAAPALCAIPSLPITDLWLNDNKIEAEFYRLVEGMGVEVLYIHNNPISEHSRYKERFASILPRLTSIDNEPPPRSALV